MYIFDINSGEQLQILTDANGIKNDHYGISLVTTEDKLIAGSHRDNTGVIHIFDLADPFEITTSIDGNGTINSTKSGSRRTFYFTADEDNEVAKVLIDGVDQGAIKPIHLY